MRNLILVLALLFALPALGAGNVYVVDGGNSTLNALARARSTMGLTFGELLALLPSRFVNLGTDPSGQQKVTAIAALQPRGIVYWSQTDIADECASFVSFATMAAQGCSLRDSSVLSATYDEVREGFRAVCSDNTLIMVLGCA